jgi:hypothetical protein
VVSIGYMEAKPRRFTMLTYTVPQIVFFLMVASVAFMVVMIVARMLKA